MPGGTWIDANGVVRTGPKPSLTSWKDVAYLPFKFVWGVLHVIVLFFSSMFQGPGDNTSKSSGGVVKRPPRPSAWGGTSTPGGPPRPPPPSRANLRGVGDLPTNPCVSKGG